MSCSSNLRMSKLNLILIVDDEPDILIMTSKIVEQITESIITARNGEDALTILSKCTPDLIILDAVMPIMHGLDVCRTLRRNKKTRGIPILIFSALGTGVDMMLDERDKADAYISKPFTSQILLEKIKNICKQNEIS